VTPNNSNTNEFNSSKNSKKVKELENNLAKRNSEFEKLLQLNQNLLKALVR
jgi:hypothetical protein